MERFDYVPLMRSLIRVWLLVPMIAHAATLSMAPSTALTGPAPATAGFTFVANGQQYVDAYGNTASDWLSSYRITRWVSVPASNNIPASQSSHYEGAFEQASLAAGVYTYDLDVFYDHPEPYDRWTEAHWELEHDNPDDPEEVTGQHWVNSYREVGFDWSVEKAYGNLRFVFGDATPVIVTSPQSTAATLGTVAHFGATVGGSEYWYNWQRLPAGGGTWTNVPYGSGYTITQPGGWPPGSSMLNVAVTSFAMTGDQFRCVVSNPAGSTASASATLTVNRIFFSGGQALAVSYVTPQQTAGPASVNFSMRFSGNTYTDANGGTASDQMASYTVFRPDGTIQVYPLYYNTHHVPGAPENVFQANYSEFATLSPGVYSYGITLRAWHPVPFDRWVEAHWDYEHDNPDDPEEVTGQRWVDAHREVGFDWGYMDLESATVPFYIGVTPPVPLGLPTFHTPPTPKVVIASGTVTFFASAISETMADFRWQRLAASGGGWADVAFGGNYSIETANNRSTCSVSGTNLAMNGDQFRCVVSNAAGSATSDGAVLTVQQAPVFVTHPVSRSAVANTSVNMTFTATATGNPAPAYRWQRSNGSAWVDIAPNDSWFSGTGTSTLTFLGGASAGLWLRCVATNSVGSGESQSARLEIAQPPAFTSQPANCTVTAGFVTNFNVSVSGTPPIAYLWRRRNLDGSWTDLSTDSNCTGATSAGLAIWNTSVMLNGAAFQCVATNSGGTASSQYAYVNVQGPLGFSTNPQNQTAAPGGAVTFTAVANGYPAPSYYQWQRFVDGQWRDIGAVGGPGSYSGVYTNTLTVSGATVEMNGYRYRCLTSNGETSGYSSEAILTVPLVLAVSHLTSSSFRLTWLGETATGGPVTYRITTQPGGLDTPNATQPFDVTGLTAGTTYTTEVQAIDAGGTVFRSVPLKITPRPAPPAAPPPPPPPPEPSKWLDVWRWQNGHPWTRQTDGILDEVFLLDEPARNSTITITNVLHEYSFTVLGAQAANPFALVFVVDWVLDPSDAWGNSFTAVSDADGNYDGPVGDDLGAYFVHVTTTYSGKAEFDMEPGYQYAVYSMTDGANVSNPSQWTFEGDAVAVAGTSRGRVELGDIQPPTRKWYRLVRYGQPLGFASIPGLPSVGLGSIMGSGGVIDVLLPSGGAIINVSDLANKIIKAGPQIVVDVWDAITGIHIGSSSVTLGGVLNTANLGITTSGQWNVGIKVGETAFLWFKLNTVTPVLEPIMAPTGSGVTPPYNPSGFEIGTQATFQVSFPGWFTGVSDNDVTWTGSAGVSFVGGNNKGKTVTITSVTPGLATLQVQITGHSGPPPTVTTNVFAKKTVKVFVYVIRTETGANPTATQAQITDMLNDANTIFKQAAIEFVQQGAINNIDIEDFQEISPANDWAKGKELTRRNAGTGGVELYLVREITGDPAGVNIPASPSDAEAGIIIEMTGLKRKTLAHELGHACGLADIYIKWGIPSVELSALEKVRNEWLPDDWNSGPDPQYYSSALTQKELVSTRLLMYGDATTSVGVVIPRGTVYGVSWIGAAPIQVKVGLKDMGNRDPKHP